MYYILRHQIKQNNQAVQHAKLVGDRPKYKPLWWSAEPLNRPHPIFMFQINPDETLNDSLWTGTEFHLFSKRLLNIFASENIQFERFPARIINKYSKSPVFLDYEVFRLLEIYSALDIEKSDISSPYIRKLVLFDEVLNSQKLFFRIKEHENLILVHEKLKTKLLSFGISGFEYVPYQDYKTTLDSIIQLHP